MDTPALHALVIRTCNVRLTADDLRWLDARLPRGAAAGERYNPMLMAILDRS